MIGRSIHPMVVLMLHAWAILLCEFEPTVYNYVTTFSGWASAGIVAMLGLYVVVMRYKRQRDAGGGLEWHEKAVAYPLLAIGYPLDVALNWTYIAVLFWDGAEEATITARLNRYMGEPEYRATWRRALAWDLGRRLNQYDRGHVG